MPEANEGCSGGGGWLMLLMTIGGVALIVLWLALGSSALTLLPLLLLLPARSFTHSCTAAIHMARHPLPGTSARAISAKVA